MKLIDLQALADPHLAIEKSQRFLISAHEAVQEVLGTLDVLRNVRKEKQGDIRGRLAVNEEDQLRAAIIFTGAGLDSTLKQLIRDTLPRLLFIDEGKSKFEAFATSRLRSVESTDPRMVARYMTAPDPRSRLIEDYIYELTGSSLQSADEVGKVAGALGVKNKDLRKRITALKPLFVARNEISHELDLQSPEKRGDRTRRTRAMKSTKKICDEGFGVGQGLINVVDAKLKKVPF